MKTRISLVLLLSAALLATNRLSVMAWEPEQSEHLVKPEDLAESLSSAATSAKLSVLCVGFPILYRGGHIVGSTFAGPASKPDGILALRREVQSLPRDRRIVLYCGCCPWKDCPNVRPAFNTLQEMGFKNVVLLYLPHNFLDDWISKGFPVQKGDEAK
jgi:hypothetical protein